jgi:hypothetical protein
MMHQTVKGSTGMLFFWTPTKANDGLTFQVFNVGVEMTYIRLPMSDVRCPMSDVRLPMSDSR